MKRIEKYLVGPNTGTSIRGMPVSDTKKKAAHEERPKSGE